MARWGLGFCAALVACSGENHAAAPPAVIAIAPTTADAGAPVAPSLFDTGLPQNAAWVASCDGQAMVDFLTSAATLIKAEMHVDIAPLIDLGVDSSRPVLIAQLGPDEAQRKTVAAILSANASERVGLIEQGIVLNAESPTFRIVVPVKDMPPAKAAAAKFFTAMGLHGDGDTFDGALRVDLVGTAGTLVIDVAEDANGKARLTALRAQVRAGHADAPARAAGDAFRLTYRLPNVTQIAVYQTIERVARMNQTPKFSQANKQRVSDDAIRRANMLMALADPAWSVDILARRAGESIAIETRVTPGSASDIPLPEAWKPSASVAPDGSEGYFIYSRPLASAWKLPGESAAPSLTSSPVNAASGIGVGLFLALPFTVPLFARLTAQQTVFPESAFERFDRAGIVLPADGSRIDFGLVVTPADAWPILAAKLDPKVGGRLKPDAPAVPFDDRFARILTVKGSRSLVVAVGEKKASLDALKLHATKADPFEASLPKDVGGQEIPWLMPSQRMQLDVGLDHGVIRGTALQSP